MVHLCSGLFKLFQVLLLLVLLSCEMILSYIIPNDRAGKMNEFLIGYYKPVSESEAGQSHARHQSVFSESNKSKFIMCLNAPLNLFGKNFGPLSTRYCTCTSSTKHHDGNNVFMLFQLLSIPLRVEEDEQTSGVDPVPQATIAATTFSSEGLEMTEIK